ncbi:glycosyltransferase family 39 protein [Lactobacillus selangorensis]
MKSKRKVDWYLVVILLPAAFLYGWGIWNAGSANSYYTAAVTSMVKSWKNFWYGAFDPAGFITVDKPPVALWFMAISAKIFGVHGWSVVLPSVLFGIGSVALMYKMIKPYFGVWPARLAALTLTLSPMVVADSRTNNMDAALVFFLMWAGYILQQAVVKKSSWRVIVSFGLIGIAFNIKMLQAFMLLPAMYFFYWLAVKKPWQRKTGLLLVATAVLAIFTLAWPVAVDATPASQRPYIGSSQKNSVLELAFGYNGAERLLGQSTGTGGAFPGMNTSKSKKSAAPTGTKKPSGTKAPTGKKPANLKGIPEGGMGGAPTGSKTGAGGPGGSKGGTGGGGIGGNNIFNIGTAGPLRLFQSALGPQISWLLPFALIGMFGAYWAYRKRKNKWYQTTTQQNQIWYWVGWLIPVAGFFSVASFYHPYYTIMLAPPIAALFGISLPVLWRQFKHGTWKQWTTYLLPLAFVITMCLQAYYVGTYYFWASMALLVIAFVLMVLIFAFKKRPKTTWLAGATTFFLLLTPGLWSLTPTLAEESAAVPTTGPDLLSQGGASSGNLGGSVDQSLLKYLNKHESKSTKYLFATTDANSASAYIIKTGRAVMAIGGYNGTDPAITLKQFKQLVAKGEIKYFYVSSQNSNSAIVKWVKKNGSKISAVSSSSSSTQPGGSSQGMTEMTGEQPNSSTSANGQPTPPSGTAGQTGEQPGGTQPGGQAPTGTGAGEAPAQPSGTKKKPANGKTTKKPSKQPAKPSGSKSAGGGMGGGMGGTLYKLSVAAAKQ